MAGFKLPRFRYVFALNATHALSDFAKVMKSIAGTIGKFLFTTTSNPVLTDAKEKIPGLGPLVEKIQDSISGRFTIHGWLDVLITLQKSVRFYYFGGK